jgi:hypothetical protein
MVDTAYAVVRNSDGKIVNRSTWDGVSEGFPPAGHTAVEDSAGLYDIGGTLIGNTYTPPPPQVISPEQLRTANFVGDTLRQEIVAVLRDGTPAQIEAFVRTKINADAVTNLATAIAFAKRTETAFVQLAKALALIVRQ